MKVCNIEGCNREATHSHDGIYFCQFHKKECCKKIDKPEGKE